ncbi:MAG TPA: hypothetical protein VFN67_31600 [Polyangiales bacterium]|nr:hypothetical protein [Polyangiales bacterium]
MRVWLICGVCLFTKSVHADDALDAWASWALAPKVWKGQTVIASTLEPAPEQEIGLLTLGSLEYPLRLHTANRKRAEQTLLAFERAYTTLQTQGWPLPTLDGQLGGGPDIDLYVLPGVAKASLGVAGPLTPSDFDAALTYARIADDLPRAELFACVHSALAQAGLSAIDPAEAASWVFASAELSVWQLTGELGCDGSLSSGQQQAELGLLNSDRASGNAGALFLGMLSERVEREPGWFVRSLWETTRQRSTGLVAAERLRSSPDLWEVLRVTLEAQHIKLDDELIEFGVARYFAGPSARKAQAPYRILAALPSDAAVPLMQDLRSSQLPVKLSDHAPLHDLGRVYVRVKLDDRSHERLQVWLHGELGARWSLTAVRLSERGRELGRTAAPPRTVPSAYLPIMLDTETAEVVLVVTQLPVQNPDADLHVDSSHGYELIVEASAN